MIKNSIGSTHMKVSEVKDISLPSIDWDLTRSRTRIEQPPRIYISLTVRVIDRHGTQGRLIEFTAPNIMLAESIQDMVNLDDYELLLKRTMVKKKRAKK